MIQPRLNIYSSALKQLMEAGPIGIMFGSADGWAWYHNTYLDILTHSGGWRLFGSALPSPTFQSILSTI